MASFKMMSSSNSRNSHLSRRNSSSASSSPFNRSNHLRHADHSRVSFGSDSKPLEMSIDVDRSNGDRNSVNGGRKSVDDVWEEIVSGEKKTIMKEEADEEDIMTLEDFLAKAAEMDYGANGDVKISPKRLRGDGGYTFDYQKHNPFKMIGQVKGSIGGGMDKVAAQRQKRMIKNRESAARSRERKQAYQVELETLAAKLEEENEQLLKEIEEKTKERYKKLMEQLILVDEKPSQSSRSLSRSHSSEW